MPLLHKPQHGGRGQQLIGQGVAVKTIDVNDTGLKDFKRIANKYGLDFAVVKNRDPETERYTVFFKARDDDAITKTMQDYAKRYKAKDHGKDKDRTEKKPSVIKKLKELKEKIASMPRKQKEKRKEYER